MQAEEPVLVRLPMDVDVLGARWRQPAQTLTSDKYHPVKRFTGKLLWLIRRLDNKNRILSFQQENVMKIISCYFLINFEIFLKWLVAIIGSYNFEGKKYQ